jgi:hypothetical protein
MLYNRRSATTDFSLMRGLLVLVLAVTLPAACRHRQADSRYGRFLEWPRCFAFEKPLTPHHRWSDWLILDTAAVEVRRRSTTESMRHEPRAVLLGGLAGSRGPSRTSWVSLIPDSIYVRSEVIPLPGYRLQFTPTGLSGTAEMVSDVIERDSTGRPYAPITRWPVVLQELTCDSVPQHRAPSQN